MATAFFMFGGIAMIAVMVVIYDWLSRRSDNKSHRA
jgi:hypothetical protein